MQGIGVQGTLTVKIAGNVPYCFCLVSVQSSPKGCETGDYGTEWLSVADPGERSSASSELPRTGECPLVPPRTARRNHRGLTLLGVYKR